MSDSKVEEVKAAAQEATHLCECGKGGPCSRFQMRFFCRECWDVHVTSNKELEKMSGECLTLRGKEAVLLEKCDSAKVEMGNYERLAHEGLEKMMALELRISRLHRSVDCQREVVGHLKGCQVCKGGNSCLALISIEKKASRDDVPYECPACKEKESVFALMRKAVLAGKAHRGHILACPKCAPKASCPDGAGHWDHASKQCMAALSGNSGKALLQHLERSISSLDFFHAPGNRIVLLWRDETYHLLEVGPSWPEAAKELGRGRTPGEAYSAAVDNTLLHKAQ